MCHVQGHKATKAHLDGTTVLSFAPDGRQVPLKDLDSEATLEQCHCKDKTPDAGTSN